MKIKQIVKQGTKVVAVTLVTSSLLTPSVFASSQVKAAETTKDKGVSVRMSADTVYIPDANLKALLNAKLGSDRKPNDDITKTQLEGISGQLNLNDDKSEHPIKNLQGMQFLTNVTELYLRNNPDANDWTPIKGMKKLSFIYAPGVGLTNKSLEPLRYLENLAVFSANGNPDVSDISPFANLKNISEIDLENSSITDITPLKDMTSLTHLDFTGNKISDVTALKDMTNLTNLQLSENKISDVTALKDMTNLTHLHLSENKISDVTALKDMTSLEELYLSENKISDVTALKDMTNLTNLHLYGNNISDVTALKDMTNLTNLHLYGNNISDVTALKDMTSLEELYLSENKISDVTALKDMTKLTVLDLGNNNISDFSPLGGLPITSSADFHPTDWNQTVSANEDGTAPGIKGLDGKYLPLSLVSDNGVAANDNSNVVWDNSFSGEQATFYFDDGQADGLNGKVTVNFLREGKVTMNLKDNTSGDLLKGIDLTGKIGTDYTAIPAASDVPQGYWVQKYPATQTGQYTKDPISLDFGLSKSEVAKQVKHISFKTKFVRGDQPLWSNIPRADKAVRAANDTQAYNGKNVEIIEKATTGGKFTYYKFAIDGKTIGWTDRVSFEVQPITVKYVDSKGKELAQSEATEGELGKAYEVKPKAIAKYWNQTAPSNRKGKFDTKAHTVTFKYAKSETAKNVKKLNKSGTISKTSEAIWSNIPRADKAVRIADNANAYKGKTVKVIKQATTGGKYTYYQFQVGGKTIGWMDKSAFKLK